MHVLRVGIAAASCCALGGALYGCSGDDTASHVSLDAGLDAVADHSVSDSSAVPDSTATDSGHEGDTSVVTDGAAVTQKVSETILFSDLSDAGAAKQDPNLVNPWGLAFSGTGIAWVSDNGAGLVTTYTPTSPGPVMATVLTPDGGGIASPTGQIRNGTSTDFMGDVFILTTEDGTIQGWQPGTSDAGLSMTFAIRVDDSASAASYKGLAIIPSTPPVLVAADFHNNKLAVFDTAYAPVPGDGGTAWTHPSLPAGYAPFNIAAIGTQVFVAYALQDSMMHDAVAAAGNGIVSVFDDSGAFVKDLVTVGHEANAPWGMAIAPAGWGSIGGSLIVGNFGDGQIHSFDPSTGALTATFINSTGATFSIDGLWALVFGETNVDAGESTNQLYFTAGINAEADGLFGFLSPQ